MMDISYLVTFCVNHLYKWVHIFVWWFNWHWEMNFHDDFEWISSANITDAKTVYFVLLCIYLLNVKWLQVEMWWGAWISIPVLLFFFLISFRQVHMNVTNERKKMRIEQRTTCQPNLWWIFLSDYQTSVSSEFWNDFFFVVVVVILRALLFANFIHVKCSNIVLGNFVLYAFNRKKV